MRRKPSQRHRRAFALMFLAIVVAVCIPTAGAQTSRPIADVLRDPLPSEDLRCSEDATRIVVQGPTFRYAVEKASGAIVELNAARDGQFVAELRGPAGVWLDETRLADLEGGVTEIVENDRDRVVVFTRGAVASHATYTARSTFYDDGVAVTEVTIEPREDMIIRDGIRFEVSVSGRFHQYLHKRRDTNGMDCLKGALPEAGQSVAFSELTSCVQAFGHEGALAIFTDRGGTHRSTDDMGTASLHVDDRTRDAASVTLAQHIVRIADGAPAYVSPAGEAFTFRVGLAIAPNRLPHPRWRDLRTFTYAGDDRNPYPTNEEIASVARLGFTLFQMHRLGTPGEPRPPAGELERVIDAVHRAGMLFIWTANADLLYANAPRVQAMRASGDWAQWQGFNYGGRYTAPMDAYCDLIATCLASPNGLSDYRIEGIERMLERYDVDGMYIDDNLAYANCTLQAEHGHPEPVYDCLIELHEMNWRRRKALKAAKPHAVLIDHCSRGLVLPVISAFDVHLFGEGYSFSSVEAYWNSFGTLRNMNAQGSLWPGDSEPDRCSAETAYLFDLLTGGGQYGYLDWRLWPEKFPYAAGVHPDERRYVKTYNLAQYYFGLYESEPRGLGGADGWFTASAAGTYAAAYTNKTWDDALLVVANTADGPATTSVRFEQPIFASDDGKRRVAVFDVHQRTVSVQEAPTLEAALKDVSLAPTQMKLFYLRPVDKESIHHLWGGKRIAETWNASTRTLTVDIHGPEGLEDSVFLFADGLGVETVTIDGEPASFFTDPGNRVIHGTVTFADGPVRLGVVCSPDGANGLPVRPTEPDGDASK